MKILKLFLIIFVFIHFDFIEAQSPKSVEREILEHVRPFKKLTRMIIKETFSAIAMDFADVGLSYMIFNITITSKIAEVLEVHSVPSLEFFNDIFIMSMSSTYDTFNNAVKGQNVASSIFEYINIYNTILTKEIKKQSVFINSFLSNHTSTYNCVFSKVNQIYTKATSSVSEMMLKVLKNAKNTFHKSIRQMTINLDSTTNDAENAIEDCIEEETSDDVLMCIDDFILINTASILTNTKTITDAAKLALNLVMTLEKDTLIFIQQMNELLEELNIQISMCRRENF